MRTEIQGAFHDRSGFVPQTLNVKRMARKSGSCISLVACAYSWSSSSALQHIKSVERGMVWGHPKPRQGRPLDPSLVPLQPDLVSVDNPIQRQSEREQSIVLSLISISPHSYPSDYLTS